MAPDGPLAFVDCISLSAHKFHGPYGIGLLACREKLPDGARPIMYGGGQQQGLRPGTESVGALVAMADALADAQDAKRLVTRQTLYRTLVCAAWQTVLPFVVSGLVLPLAWAKRRGRASPRAGDGTVDRRR